MRACACIDERLDDATTAQDVVILDRRFLATTSTRLNNLTRNEAQELLIAPDIRLLVPIVFAPDAAITNDQRRRVAHLRRAPQLGDILVHAFERQRVLDAGVAVDHHRQVVLQQRATFRHHHDADFARGGEHHLALITARLVVALDADGADGLQALQMATRIIQRLDLCFEAALGAVQDRAGRPRTRREDCTRARQLADSHDRVRVIRRIVNGGHAVREIRTMNPVVARDHAACALRTMCMHINQARHNGHTAAVNHARIGRHRRRAARTHGNDAIRPHHHHAVVDDIEAAHRHQLGPHQGEHMLRLGVRHLKADVQSSGHSFGHTLARAQLSKHRTEIDHTERTAQRVVHT